MKRKLFLLLAIVVGIALIAVCQNGFNTAEHFLIGTSGDVGLRRTAAAELALSNGSTSGYGTLRVLHYGQGGANTDAAGTKTLAAGAGTVTFGTAYAQPPVCVGTDQTAAAAVKMTTTTTTLTIAGTTTDVIAYQCIGNPN